MCGDHAKREIVTGDKPASSGRTLSRESGHKHKEESSSSNKTHRKGDMKKMVKKFLQLLKTKLKLIRFLKSLWNV